MKTKEWYTCTKDMPDGSTRIYLNGGSVRNLEIDDPHLEDHLYLKVDNGFVSIHNNAGGIFTAYGARSLAEATAIAAEIVSRE